MNKGNTEELTGVDVNRTYADYIDAFRSIFQLTNDDVESTFIKVKEILLNKYKFQASDLFTVIEKALYLRDRYMKSYLKLYDMVNSLFNDSFKLSAVYHLKEIIKAFDSNDYSMVNHYDKMKDYIELLKPNSLFSAIMNDDIETFTSMANQYDFNPNITMTKFFFQYILQV